MKGKLADIYRAQLVKSLSGSRPNVAGTLGVFDYEGAGRGNVCLFAPDDPEMLGNRKKLRPGPGIAQLEGDMLQFTVKDDGGSYAWQLASAITDPDETQAFLEFAEANDRIIRHLLEGDRLLED